MACEVRKVNNVLRYPIVRATIRGFVTAREGDSPESRTPLVSVSFPLSDGTTFEGSLTDSELTSWEKQLKQAREDVEAQWAKKYPSTLVV